MKKCGSKIEGNIEPVNKIGWVTYIEKVYCLFHSIPGQTIERLSIFIYNIVMVKGKNILGSLKEGHSYTFVFLMVDIVNSAKIFHLLSSKKSNEILLVFHDLVTKNASEYDGYLFMWAGDGGLIAFPLQDETTVHNAIFCAQRILNRISTIKIQNMKDFPMNFEVRIAIHMGEVVFSKDPSKIVSSTINMVAQLEKQAYPNSITISDTVYNHLPSSLRILYRRDGFFGDCLTYTSEKLHIEKPPSKVPQEELLNFEKSVKDTLSKMGYTVISGVSGPDLESDLLAYGKLPGIEGQFKILVECKFKKQEIKNDEIKIFNQKIQDYGVKFGLIVSKSDFTFSAKELAQKLGIFLLTKDELQNLLSKFALKSRSLKIENKIKKK